MCYVASKKNILSRHIHFYNQGESHQCATGHQRKSILKSISVLKIDRYRCFSTFQVPSYCAKNRQLISKFYETAGIRTWEMYNRVERKNKMLNLDIAIVSNVLQGPNKYVDVIWGHLNDIIRCRRAIEKEKNYKF